MMEGSISKYNGLLLLTPYKSYGAFLFGFTMVGAHISSLLSFRFFVTIQISIAIFLPFRMALKQLPFFFFMLSFQPMNILYKKEGRFSIIFRQSVY